MQVGLHGHRGEIDESCETTGEVTEDAPYTDSIRLS